LSLSEKIVEMGIISSDKELIKELNQTYFDAEPSKPPFE
jgi:hypothetical protein